MNFESSDSVVAPIYQDVPGAPFKIGDQVIILTGIDETFDHASIGHKGTIFYFEYSCGCGQTYPEDPMIGVLLDTGKAEEFWQEELRLDNIKICT